MQLDVVVVTFVNSKTKRNHTSLSPYVQYITLPVILSSASLNLTKASNPLNSMVLSNYSTDSKQVNAKRHCLMESFTIDINRKKQTCTIPY